MTATKTKTPKSAESYEDKVLKEVGPAVKAVLLERVMLATPGLDPKSFKMPVDTPKDPKTVAVEKAIRDNQFNHGPEDNKALANILSVVLCVKLELEPKSKAPFVQPYMLVVPLTSINRHDYTVGSVCMFRSEGGKHAMEVVRGSVRVGNEFPSSCLGDDTNVRFASKVEAEEFVGKVTSSLANIQAVRAWVRDLDTYLDKV